MELWKIIVLSLLGTLSLVWLLYVICSAISDAKKRKKRREEWYMQTLMKLMERVDEIECDIDVIAEDIENIANDIYVEENYYEKFNRQNSNR